MIPYDDLVIALATWRARQGLPVSSLSGALTPPGFAQAAAATAPPPMPVRAPAPPTPSRSTAPQAAVAAPMPTPPTPPSGPTAAAVVPPPLAPPPEDSLDNELLEAEGAYENEGDDFAVAFGAATGHHGDEATAIGAVPPRPSIAGNDTFGGLTDPHPHVPGALPDPGEATGEHTIAGAELDPDRKDW